MAKARGTGHRITSNALHTLRTHYENQGRHYEYDELPRHDLLELLALAPFAHREWRDQGILKSDHNFRVMRKETAEILWVTSCQVVYEGAG